MGESVARVNRIVEIDAGEDGEHVGLQERDQQFERGQRDRQAERQRRRRASRATPSAPSMVTKPPNTLSVMWPASMLANRRTLWEIGRDRNDSTSMNDDQRQDVDRNAARHEQLEEVQAVLPEAVDDDGEEHEQRERHRDDDVARHREGVGDDARRCSATRMNMNSENTSGKNFMPFAAGGAAQRVGDELVGHLGDRLQAARHQRARAVAPSISSAITPSAISMNSAELVKAISVSADLGRSGRDC